MESRQNCQLCSQESCCPEHCCDWDSCECEDCYQCTANKLSKEFAMPTYQTDHKYDDPSSVVNVNSPQKKPHESVDSRSTTSPK